MATFRNRPLPVLDRIYGFLSGRTSPPEIQTESPLTLVHDVSREAELGAAYGRNLGYGVQNMTQAYNSFAVEEQQQDAYSWLLSGFDPQLDPYENDVSIWIVDCHATSTVPADMDAAVLAIGNYGTLTPSTIETYRVLSVWDTDYATGSNYTATGNVYNHVPEWEAQWPILVHRGERLLLGVDGGGSGSLVVYIYYWVGRKGTTPPKAR